MNNIDYAYSVAHVRAIENKLLTSSDFENIISAKTKEEAINIISEKGYQAEADGGIKGTEYLLEQRMNEAWKVVLESAPDRKLFDILLYENDFENLKVVLKGIFTDSESYRALLVSPSVTDSFHIEKTILDRNFSDLPEIFSGCAEEAFQYLSSSLDADRADSVIDRKCMDVMMNKAKESKNEFLIELVKTKNTFKNIKIAYRSAVCGKDFNFLDTALTEESCIEKSALIKAVLSGKAETLDFISSSGYDEEAKLISSSYSEFETYIDNKLTERAKNSIYTAFGIEPLVAYILKVGTEVKNLRIILTSKENGIKENEIRLRMRNIV